MMNLDIQLDSCFKEVNSFNVLLNFLFSGKGMEYIDLTMCMHTQTLKHVGSITMLALN